ncbi:MAG: ATP-binding cassette domain-containing protein [Archaeoglobaceae archaeon]
MLRVEALSKRLGRFEMRDVSFEVGKGEYLVILGPSGAGKTTLLETIAGIREPDAGRVLLDGEDITLLPPERRKIAYIPQNYALFPHLSVLDNIAYGLRIRGLPRSEIERRVLELADVLGITHLLNRKPKTLSGGEQQRVAIARAVAVQPKVLLLDEPLSNVDLRMRAKLIDEIRRWRKELELTALHVTHSLEEAFSLADRVGVMLNGRLAELGCPEDVFRSPKSEEVARFLGYEVYEGYADGEFVDIGIKLRSRARGRVKVGILPSSVKVGNGEFRGRVVDVRRHGYGFLITIDAGVLMKALSERVFRIGEEVQFSVSSFCILS